MSSMYKRLWWTPRWRKGDRISRRDAVPFLEARVNEIHTYKHTHTHILSPQEKVINTNTHTCEYAEAHTIINPPNFKKHDSSMPNPWMKRRKGGARF